MRLTRWSSAGKSPTGRRISWIAALAAAAALGLPGPGGAVAAERAQVAVLFCFGTITMNVNPGPGGVVGNGNLTCDEPSGSRRTATIRISGSVGGGSGMVTETFTTDTITYSDGQVSTLDVGRRLEKLSGGTSGDAQGTGNGRVDSGQYAGAGENEQGSGTFRIGINGTAYTFGDFSLGLSQ
ncbi:hypothetical protein [Streptomyces syringium]|uniref:hypothetical protein n=1 Tax=Streptomyces syringium TaxID=76729 RepID=UPI003418B224